MQQENLKHKIEAILFTVNKALKIEEIAGLIRFGNKERIKEILDELKREYSDKDSALEIIEENNGYRMNIRSSFIPVVKNLMPDTEFDRAMIETLAVIAWKQPVLQSEVVKVRGNRAYEHIKLLGELGFVSTERSKLTKLVKLTPKFFQYFDTSKKIVKEKLGDVKEGSAEKKSKEEIPDLLKDV